MINNGSVHYDHDRDGTHTMIGGCEVKFRNFAHDTYLNIRYENDVLTGTIAPCLKITQNVAFEFFDLGISHQFLSYKKVTSLVTLFDRKLLVFKKIAKINHF